MDEFAPIPEILDELRAGRFVVLVDDPNRENEGDVVMAAEKITPEHVNFMLRKVAGEICVCVTEDAANRMGLDPQVSRNTSPFATGKCVTVDAATGTTTGVSAQDQAKSILKLADTTSQPHDFTRPGHTRPIRARDGGVLVRTGHTEGSVDLCRLAGLTPAAALCEILGEDGRPMRLPALREFAATHGFKMTTIEEVIRWRRARQSLVQRIASTRIPTPHGVFQIHLFANDVDTNQHVALTMGVDVPQDGGAGAPIDEPLLVRMHSECLTGDIFGSLRCDCGAQLDNAIRAVGEAGRGAILYLRQEGRGIGLEKKLLAYRLQEHGMDTVEANKALGFRADERDYGIGAQMLHHLGVRRMLLMTNNPKKRQALAGFGLSIETMVPIEMPATRENVDYLRAKRDKLGHLLEHLPAE
jgi:3,4-dihydroxy 2-butanone 4-phosphate synthase/GTP cyclohydrolase II